MSGDHLALISAFGALFVLALTALGGAWCKYHLALATANWTDTLQFDAAFIGSLTLLLALAVVALTPTGLAMFGRVGQFLAVFLVFVVLGSVLLLWVNKPRNHRGSG